jgi:RNA polymerase sigma-70 factor (ECF subfamily)
MTVSDEFREQLIAAIPSLRAFAVSLCGNATRADDLVQETLVKAWANRSIFEPGTNLRA